MFLFGRDRRRIKTEQPSEFLETIKEYRSIPKLPSKKSITYSAGLFYKYKEVKKPGYFKEPHFFNKTIKSPYISEI